MNFKYILTLLISTCYLAAEAQSNTEKTKNKARIRLSGYLQAQFQAAQRKGVSSWQGGDFDAASNNRYIIRRGRLKLERSDDRTKVVFQIDGKPDGLVFNDAYIEHQLKADWPLYFSLGLSDKAFGYALSYSSSNRDFPERPMMYQSLFPKEKDVGATLSYKLSKSLPFLSVSLSAVNGNGLAAKDYDKHKDFLGNLHFSFKENKRTQIGFGSSFYWGKVEGKQQVYYKPTTNGYLLEPGIAGQPASLSRRYLGFDFQLEHKSAIGTSSLKTEYIFGQHPGLATSPSVSVTAANRSLSSQTALPLYHRNFMGYYLWLNHQIGKSPISLLFSYDIFDPNTKLSGSQIGLAGSNTSAGDLRFNNFGAGIAFDLDENTKLSLYHDAVENERSQIAEYLTDVKDNVFTFRLQYKW